MKLGPIKKKNRQRLLSKTSSSNKKMSHTTIHQYNELIDGSHIHHIVLQVEDRNRERKSHLEYGTSEINQSNLNQFDQALGKIVFGIFVFFSLKPFSMIGHHSRKDLSHSQGPKKFDTIRNRDIFFFFGSSHLVCDVLCIQMI